MSTLLQIALMLAPLSFVAIGGANSILPDVHRQVVGVHAWMSESEFADAFTLAQAVPGPNILLVSLIGFKVAGVAGAIVAVLATCGPSSVLALIVARGLHSPRVAPWRRRIQTSLGPLTLGLVLAAASVLARSADQTLLAAAVTLVTAAIVLRTNVHPVLLMGAGAVLGLAHIL